MACLYPRGKTFWIIYYKDGKKIQRSLKTTDKRVAQYRKNEIEMSLARGESPLPDLAATASQCLDAFKKSRAGIISDQTEKTDIPRIREFIKDSGISKIRDITEEKLKAHLDKRILNDGISNMTANHTIRAMKTFLSFCVRKNYISESPIKHMTKYPIDQKEPRFLSSDEIRALVSAAEGSPIRHLVLTAVYTGMRLGEIERLTWDDIDFESGTITVLKSKSKKFRKIPLHKELRAELLLIKKNGGAFFDPMTRKALDWQFELIKNKMISVPHFRFHDLRHTFASMMIKSGVDIYTVSRFLGHSGVAVTERYSHLYQDHANEAMKRLQF